MKIYLTLLLLLVLGLSTPGISSAQSVLPGSTATKSTEVKQFSHCVLFYLTSYNKDVLPWDDICMVRDKYSLETPQRVRVFGPVDGNIDLFRAYDWSINFHLPIVEGPERLSIVKPESYMAGEHDMADGSMFFTISDNRNKEKFGRVADNVDFVAVSGRAKVVDFQPREGDMKYPYYNLQIDATVRKVDRTGGGDQLVGPPVRLKMVLLVKEQEK